MCISEKEIQQMTDASFSQSESLKPCRGQSESSRWSLNASRDKWERNTEEIDLICAAVYINTIYSTEKGAIQRIHSFTNNVIRERTWITSLLYFSPTGGWSYCMTSLSSQIITGRLFSNMIFLLLQIYYIAFVLNVRVFEHLRCFDCFVIIIWTSEMNRPDLSLSLSPMWSGSSDPHRWHHDTHI